MLELDEYLDKFELQKAYSRWKSSSMPSKYFFLSFRSTNTHVADEIHRYLSSFFGEGAVYYSNTDRTTGKWLKKLQNALAQCRYFVMLASEEGLRTERAMGNQAWEFQTVTTKHPDVRLVVASLQPVPELTAGDVLLNSWAYGKLEELNWATGSSGDFGAASVAADIIRSWWQTEEDEGPALPDADRQAGANDPSSEASQDKRVREPLDPRSGELQFVMHQPESGVVSGPIRKQNWEATESPRSTKWEFTLRNHSGTALKESDSRLRVLSPILGEGTLNVRPDDDHFRLHLDPAFENPSDLRGYLGSHYEEFVAKALGDSETFSHNLGEFTRSLIRLRLERRRRAFDEQDTPPVVTRLRAALLQLALLANNAFMEELSAESRRQEDREKAHRSLDSYVGRGDANPLRLGFETFQAVDAAISTARSVAKELTAEPSLRQSSWSSLLGAPAIGIALGGLQESVNHSNGLTRTQVGWCADLFWHSLIYHTNGYPLSSEFFFQLILIHDSLKHSGLATAERREPARAVSAKRDMNTAGRAAMLSMGRGFELGDGTESARSRFFHGLARALWCDWDLRLCNRKPNDGLRRSKLALAFAASFDFELEAALAQEALRGNDSRGRTPREFHVVLPVVEMRHSQSAAGNWFWALATFRAKDFLDWLADRDWLGRDDQIVPHVWYRLGEFPTYPEREITGPMVVRLSGTPFIKLLPSGEDVQGRAGASEWDIEQGGAGGEHERVFGLPLAISDFDRVQFLMMDAQSGITQSRTGGSTEAGRGGGASAGSGWPEWLFTELKRMDRFWLAMGVGVQNWNSRLFLFLHTVRVLSLDLDTHLRSGSDSSQPIRALEADLEDDRVSFLAACRIQPVTGDATPRSEFFAEYVNEVAADVREHAMQAAPCDASGRVKSATAGSQRGGSHD